MAGSSTPSPNRFVVREAADAEPGALERRSARVGGAIEPLEEGSELIVLEVAEHPKGAKAAFDALRETLGPDAHVAPVLVGEDGDEHYPTGVVTVRFHRTPTDEELDDFAARHHLRLTGRNEWVDLQADFAGSQSRYLPDLVDELEREEGVRAAWPATLSRYRQR